jgi:hypothetical protein
MTNRRTGAAKSKAPAAGSETAVGSETAGRPERGEGHVSSTLRAAAALTAVEAVAATGFGIWLTIESWVQVPRGLAIAVGTGLFVLAAGVGLGVLTWGLFRARRWSRGLTVVVQLLMLPIGYEFTSSPTTLAGVGMLGAAVATLVLVLSPASTAAFGD